MNPAGTAENPLRVAVIGCGPSGFYVADAVLKTPGLVAEVDMFDRLPTPYGLVRYGVAPDHQEVKRVTKVYVKTATDPRVRWFGNVEFGKDLTLEDVRAHYHAVAFTTGAQTDRRLEIPGEDLKGSHPATEFVAWYNGHPDYRHLSFELDAERAVVIGVGNVAIDVARMLCRTPEELARTDVADYALEALRKSRVREVYLVGRRGPAQAAFTNAELEEIGEMEGADAVARPDEVALDDVTKADLAAHPDRQTDVKVGLLQKYAAPKAATKPRTLFIRFCLSPVSIAGDASGRVSSVRLVRNVLSKGADGSIKARATDRFEEVPTGLVFRSVGYRGVALPGVPFRNDWGTIPHLCGRVVDPSTNDPVVGLYVAGWIKRGPSGVIGTNRACAVETVKALATDASGGKVLAPSAPPRPAIPALLASRGVRFVTFDQWQKIDALETAKGQAAGRPRVKFVSREEIAGALGD
jgi:ferredoxin--NADP+ reductase